MPTSKSIGERFNFFPSDEEVEETMNMFGQDMKIPENFRMTAPPHKESDSWNMPPSKYYPNPQSTEFCDRLKIKCVNTLLCELNPEANGVPYYTIPQNEEIAIADDDDREEGVEKEAQGVEGLFEIDTNPTDIDAKRLKLDDADKLL
uniref:DBR1 domain-containing protein n=1 Tax=Steinernema glaseri TaxID=37863 RepID=A0A1I7ZTY4_9BILA